MKQAPPRSPHMLRLVQQHFRAGTTMRIIVATLAQRVSNTRRRQHSVDVACNSMWVRTHTAQLCCNGTNISRHMVVMNIA